MGLLEKLDLRGVAQVVLGLESLERCTQGVQVSLGRSFLLHGDGHLVETEKVYPGGAGIKRLQVGVEDRDRSNQLLARRTGSRLRLGRFGGNRHGIQQGLGQAHSSSQSTMQRHQFSDDRLVVRLLDSTTNQADLLLEFLDDSTLPNHVQRFVPMQFLDQARHFCPHRSPLAGQRLKRFLVQVIGGFGRQQADQPRIRS